MIAHQWRQPLSSISTLAGNLKVLIELDLFEEAQFQVLLEEINQHAQYLSRTINDFRHFFKPDNPRDTVLMSDIIENTLGIIGKSLEYKNVKIIKDYAFIHPLLTYPNELMQVYMNILKNASDAFITNETLEPCIVIKGYEKNGFHVVDLIDNGGGIAEEIMDKIFDPYFSTKGPAVGTGLGLYMSKIIVEEHCHGQLTAVNAVDGTCFTIKLPSSLEGSAW
jgi:signal transduction histidine kinase